ncbi:hypothetical protein PM082_014860 [Marasmius tenuissimus]|nr:hypothetical protein PM082_014860 [Marasmius tenuissimus]
MPRPFSQPPAPTIDPYPIEKSPTSPSSTVKGQSPTTDWNTTTTMTTGSENHQYPNSHYPPGTWSGSGEGSSRRAGSSVADDGSSAYVTMQAQMRMMMQRLERIEAGESEAPPDYVSSYSGR